MSTPECRGAVADATWVWRDVRYILIVHHHRPLSGEVHEEVTELEATLAARQAPCPVGAVGMCGGSSTGGGGRGVRLQQALRWPQLQRTQRRRERRLWSVWLRLRPRWSIAHLCAAVSVWAWACARCDVRCALCDVRRAMCGGVPECYLGVTRRKQQRPGIANGTTKAPNKPTMLLPNSQLPAN